MGRYVFISGTIYETEALNIDEACDKVYAFIGGDDCPCLVEDCTCVSEGDVDTILIEGGSDA